MGDVAPGSVDILMKAFGYTDSAAFRKRIEQGGLQLTPEKARAFAKELSNMANANGALAAVSEKTNAQMQRFFYQLTTAKDEIFKNGMDDGLGYMFKSLSIILKDMKPVFTAIAGAFQGFVSILVGGLRVLLAPIGMLAEGLKAVWALLGVGDKGTQQFWAIAGGAGTIALLALRFDMVRKLLKMINIELMIAMSRLLLMAAPLLAIEDLYSTMQGRKTITSTVGNAFHERTRAGGEWSASAIFGNNAVTRFLDTPMGMLFGDSKVTVEVKGDEAAKFIQATVDKSNQARTAVTQTETSQ